MKKLFLGVGGIFLIFLGLQVTSEALANPYKVVWQQCPAGSEVDYVIRCKLVGGEECFANWQGFCDEPPTIGD